MSKQTKSVKLVRTILVNFPVLRYNTFMDIVFLSAHLDDAVYSCGGLIHKILEDGQSVLVHTFFCADPDLNDLSPFAQELHARWDVEAGPMSLRRLEDKMACEFLGASFRHGEFLDCVYRKDQLSGEYLYTSNLEIFGERYAADDALIDQVAAIIQPYVKEAKVVYAPLSHGNHIDHQILRAAADRFENIHYYFDLPYGLRAKQIPEDLLTPDMLRQSTELSEEDLEAWAAASELYASQFNDYWSFPRAPAPPDQKILSSI